MQMEDRWASTGCSGAAWHLAPEKGLLPNVSRRCLSHPTPTALTVQGLGNGSAVGHGHTRAQSPGR